MASRSLQIDLSEASDGGYVDYPVTSEEVLQRNYSDEAVDDHISTCTSAGVRMYDFYVYVGRHRVRFAGRLPTLNCDGDRPPVLRAILGTGAPVPFTCRGVEICGPLLARAEYWLEPQYVGVSAGRIVPVVTFRVAWSLLKLAPKSKDWELWRKQRNPVKLKAREYVQLEAATATPMVSVYCMDIERLGDTKDAPRRLIGEHLHVSCDIVSHGCDINIVVGELGPGSPCIYPNMPADRILCIDPQGEKGPTLIQVGGVYRTWEETLNKAPDVMSAVMANQSPASRLQG